MATQLSRSWWFVIAISAIAIAPLHAQPPLKWGGDKTGGAPYIEEDGSELTGFEVELAEYLAKELQRKAVFEPVPWDNLPDALKTKRVDIVLNGYEYSPNRLKEHGVSLPYYAYNLRLIAPTAEKNSQGIRNVRSWDDLAIRDDNPPRKVSVLRSSAAEAYLRERYGDSIKLLPADDVVEMMKMVVEGRADATVQDSPAARYYVLDKRMDGLKVVDKPVANGLYVILVRTEDEELRKQINTALKKALRDGTLKEIYQKYSVWNAEQQRLFYFHDDHWPPDEDDLSAGDEEEESAKGSRKMSLWGVLDKLFLAAWMTLALALVAMPIAIVLGILIAIGRMYGPGWLGVFLSMFVELMRGTPLILQMFVWFYLVPQMAEETGIALLIGITKVPYFVYGVFGLSLNYAASEAENYRAGLMAIPPGQMEAALALGMTTAQAVRRVMLPQALRIVIPPVTNDFIALLKDTSVCSLILITELTGFYYQYKYHREILLELALAVGVMYLCLSYPLALLSRHLENRLKRPAS